MKSFESVIVIGASGSGKTTLVNGLRIPTYEDKVVIPRRFITRPERLNDDSNENAHISESEFSSRVVSGLIRPHWERTFENGRQERYGFEAVGADDRRLRVYAANNKVFSNPSFEDILDKGLVVAIHADRETRSKRLALRSPDLSEAEVAFRLQDSEIDILHGSISLEIISTAGLSPEQGQNAFREIVDSITS